MYIKIKDNKIEKYPYSINQLKQDNPDTSFPSELTNERLAKWDVFYVSQTTYPQVDYTKNVVEGEPLLRADAYRNESDPLFFKAQRNEVTMEEWAAKVNEIKTRYPKD
jgi:hypothetical protein